MLNSAKKEKYKTLALAQNDKPKFSALPLWRCSLSSQPYEVLGDPGNSEVSNSDKELFCNNEACS